MEKKEAEIIVDADLPGIDDGENEVHCYRSGTVFYVSRALNIVICRDMKQAIRNAIKSMEGCPPTDDDPRPNDFMKRKVI